MVDEICIVNEKYENNSQGQRSRSNVTNFQPLLVFTVGHIPNKLDRFPACSFRDFVRTAANKQGHCLCNYFRIEGRNEGTNVYHAFYCADDPVAWCASQSVCLSRGCKNG